MIFGNTNRPIIPDQTRGKFNLRNEFKHNGYNYMSPLDNKQENMQNMDHQEAFNMSILRGNNSS